MHLLLFFLALALPNLVRPRTLIFNQKYIFPCKPLSNSSHAPFTVHQLRPNDISIVGALGGSVTAGNAIHAQHLLEALVEYRGGSFSGGGDESYESVVTLPNILRKYNPYLTGFAIGFGSETSPNAKYNQAISGNFSNSLAQQARNLVSRIPKDREYTSGWKLITVFTGINDICHYCEESSTLTPTNYRQNLQQALDILQEELPRTFVAVVNLMDLTLLPELNYNGLTCPLTHYFLCRCAAFPNRKASLKLKIEEFQAELSDLLASDRYSHRDDFAVVEQPFLTKTQSGVDYEKFLAVDCLHFNSDGHAALAKGLWNNLFEPVGGKRDILGAGVPLACPDDGNPFLKTKKNS